MKRAIVLILLLSAVLLPLSAAPSLSLNPVPSMHWNLYMTDTGKRFDFLSLGIDFTLASQEGLGYFENLSVLFPVSGTDFMGRTFSIGEFYTSGIGLQNVAGIGYGGSLNEKYSAFVGTGPLVSWMKASGNESYYSFESLNAGWSVFMRLSAQAGDHVYVSLDSRIDWGFWDLIHSASQGIKSEVNSSVAIKLGYEI
ncbi:MAG: hypothetical protein MI717_02860 [Spirochaetales bacterium]|nr:hypothetical protein [Spirochaetales bacterium]